MKSTLRFSLGAAICAAILFIAAFSFLPVLVHADTDAEKAIKKAEADTSAAEQAAKEAAEAQKAADEAGKKAGQGPTPEDKAAEDAAKAAAETAEKADEAQDKAQEEQLEAEDAAKDAKEAGGSNEEKNKKAADEKKEADDAAEAAKKAEEEAAKNEKAADAADKKADAADKKKKADARNKRKRARDARRRAAKAIRDARRLLHEATRTGRGSESKPRKDRLDGLAERLKHLIKLAEDTGKTEEPPKQGNFIPPGDDQKAELKTANGLQTVTFTTAQGRVIVRLPDDMRAGDTISGTVVAEPKGQTPEERATNQSVLGGLGLEIDGKRVEPFSGSPAKEREPVIQQTFWIFRAQVAGKDNTVPIALIDREGQTLAQTNAQMWQMFDDIGKAGEGLTPSGAVITPDPKITQPTHPSGAIITPDPKITDPPFVFPPIGQTGRNVVVTGPFDGNAANTEVRIGDWEDRDNMGRADIIAESPRKAVFVAPSNVVGPVTMHLTEGGRKTKGSYRNLGVKLTAPKTMLLKGERTTLTVEVRGLEGLTKPAPLQLDATGVIVMDGGNFQNLRIEPAEVDQGGRYTTTRAITGQQAGGFTVVATVMVDRFDVCIADDSKRQSGILWNTFTGDYIFTNPGSPRPGGQPPTGVTVTPGGQPPTGVTVTPGGTPPAPPGGSSLTGTGKLAMKGCIITLSHNAPDRRVFARLDACTKAGDATVQTTTPATNVTITDKNVTDNTCGPK